MMARICGFQGVSWSPYTDVCCTSEYVGGTRVLGSFRILDFLGLQRLVFFHELYVKGAGSSDYTACWLP